MEEVMHKTVLSAAMALAVVGAGTLTASSAGAVTLASKTLRPAIESLNPVDAVACWRNGQYVRGLYNCGSAPRQKIARDRGPQEFSSVGQPRPRADALAPTRYFSRW
jgi:hypothetical protein